MMCRGVVRRRRRERAGREESEWLDEGKTGRKEGRISRKDGRKWDGDAGGGKER